MFKRTTFQQIGPTQTELAFIGFAQIVRYNLRCSPVLITMSRAGSRKYASNLHGKEATAQQPRMTRRSCSNAKDIHAAYVDAVRAPNTEVKRRKRQGKAIQDEASKGVQKGGEQPQDLECNNNKENEVVNKSKKRRKNSTEPDGCKSGSQLDQPSSLPSCQPDTSQEQPHVGASQAMPALPVPGSPLRIRSPIFATGPTTPKSPMPLSPSHCLRQAAARNALAFNIRDPTHVSLVLSALNSDVTVGIDQALPASQPIALATGAPYGRQKQFQELKEVITTTCKEGIGRSVYISGVPGTGKSHTVRAVLAALHAQDPSNAPLSTFISCFGVKESGGIYAVIHRHVALQAGLLSEAETVNGSSAEEAYQWLQSLLQTLSQTTTKQGGSKAKSKKHHARTSETSAPGSGRSIVIVLDEVDRLLANRKGVDDLVKLFMLPHAAGVRCCIVAMANSLDITERCLPELKLRGCSPLVLPFGAYMRVQLLEIINAKLGKLPWPVFEPAALELLARKVSSSSGDVRRALQACRIAVSILVDQTQTVGLTHDVQQPQKLSALACPLSPRRNTIGALSDLTSFTTNVQPYATAPRSPGCPMPGNSAKTMAGLPSIVCTSPSACHRPIPTSPTRLLVSPKRYTTVSTVSLQLPAPAKVGVKEMVAALSRIAYQSGASASNVNSIRNLPQHQQLCLLALASALAAESGEAAKTAAADAAAAEHGMTTTAYRAKYYFGPSSIKPKQTKLANPFAQAGGAEQDKSTPASYAFAGDAARKVPGVSAYDQYRSLCNSMCQKPGGEQAFLQAQQTLADLGLVEVSGVQKGNAGKRSLVPSLTHSRLELKVSMREIQTALKESAVFKAALTKLPHA